MCFSVIVTVYNVEQYLNTCVDSILAQTFDDFELILVDDGSPDNCPALCDSYAAMDGRVKVIHQENGGVVNARKAGLMASQGEYIVFVDGDDWIAPTYLARGLELIRQTGTEMIVFDFSREYGDFSEVVREPAPEGLYGRVDIRKSIYPSLLMNSGMVHMSYSVFGKVFTRPLAEKGFLAVEPQITLGEDLLSVFPSYMGAENLYICHETMSFYRVREQSASHGFKMEHFGQIELVLKELEHLKEREPDLPEDFDEQTARYGAYMCFTLLVHAASDGRRDALGEIKRRLKSPSLRACIDRAEFEKITPKARLSYAFMRRNWVLPVYLLLRLSQYMKSIFKQNR